MNFPRPLEIIGGGLAGLALAGALRRAGAEVTLFEAGSYPRHRVCGEFIAGLSARTTARLGLGPLLADALRHREVAWCRDGSPIAVQPLPAPALGISRHTLDARLAQAFVAAGGDLRTRERVTELAPRPGRIFATGRRPGSGSSGWLGLKVHALGLELQRDLEVHLGDDAYVGLSAVEGGRVNVCGLFRRRRIGAKEVLVLPAYLRAAGLGALADRLARAELDPESFSAVAAVAFDRRVPAQDRVCLGDACAMIPPFTGNGMAMAFQSAEAALTPLLDYARGRSDWAAARRAIHSALRRRFRLRLASAGVLHPYLLRPPRQRWLMAMSRAHLLPLRPLYAAMH
jgi:flavin-dependent dehydrogenase